MSNERQTTELTAALQRADKLKITSEWEDMPPPRRRRYRLAKDVIDD